MPTTPELAERPLATLPSPPASERPQPGPPRISTRRRLAVAAGLLVAAAFALTRVWPLLVPAPASTVVTASGRIEGREVTLAPKAIQGRITRLLVDEGQTVTKGQLLAELDAAQVEAQVCS